MTTSSEFIQRLYHVRQSSKMSRIVDQIDLIARLLLKVFDASFVGVFYRRGDGGDCIPVAFHAWEPASITDFTTLEQRYRALDALVAKPTRGVVSIDELANPDPFADVNGFRCRCEYPIMSAGKLRGMIVVYWQEHAPAESGSSNLVNSLAELLNCWMALVEEVQATDSFSLRLSALIGLFELPLDSYSMSELVAHMLKVIRSVLRHASVGLVSREPITGQYNLVEFLPAETAHLRQRGTLERQMATLMGALAKGQIPRRAWHDLSGDFRASGHSVVGVELYRDDRYHVGVVFARDAVAGFSESDLELMSIFSLFAQSVIVNALLIRSLNATTVQVREASDRMADVETMAALADMSSGMAHDFNNIMGAVLGRLQLLKMKNEDPKLGEAYGKMEGQLQKAVDSLRKLQQFSSSVKAKPVAPIDLIAALREYLDSADRPWQALAEQKRITIKGISEIRLASVSAGPDDIATILDRLIENAVTFAPEATQVTVRLAETESRFVLSVADTGPGIPEEIRGKVFYPFFSTKGIRGAGLGLSVVYGITARLGGRTTIISRPGAGTAVQVMLDKPGAPKEVSDITRKTRKKESLRVLVVDDDEHIREILVDMLKLDGHQAASCADGQTALAQLQNQPYDFMITDLGMPGMSGLELATAAHHFNPALPIAMITGWGTQLNEDEISRNGVKAVLPKPFHLRDIRSLVAAVETTAAVPVS